MKSIETNNNLNNMNLKFYKPIAWLLAFMCLCCLQVYAQEAVQITGTVKTDKGEILAGVSVRIKNTTTGAVTDASGKYTLRVPNRSAILQISYIGFATKEIPVGAGNVLNIVLEENSNQLSDIVVTALGIKRESKKLGYSTATVNTDLLTVNRTTNVGNSLEGKIAGVNVTPPAGGPGGSTKIRIRGQSSFGGNNSPLIIVNGIPINNTSVSAGGFAGNGAGNVTGGSSDQGDGLQSINQDDIESMTVLKGAAAAALYGFRAKDGAIIITTKSGSKTQGIGIELNSNYQADQALDYTDFQYEYGQGEYGKRQTTLAEAQTFGVHAFGERFDGVPTIQFDGSMQPYSPHKDRISRFYRTGRNFSNSVAISGGSEKGSFRLSFANNDANAIMPNSDYHKKILNLGLNYKVTPKLSLQLNANYSNEYNHNPPQIGIQDMNANTTIYTLANSINTDWLKNYKDANGNEMPLSRFTNRNNPYWVALQRFENVRRDRIFGNASLRYQFTDWLYLQARIGQDYFTRPYNYNRPTGTRSIGAVTTGFNGYYYQDVTTFRERNMDFLIGANKKVKDFGFDLTLGGNAMKQVSDVMGTAVTNFFVRDLYTISNGQVKNPNYSYFEKRVNSVYGSFEVSYKNFLYITATARNDWFSTLNINSNSYLYPSVSASFVFSDAIRMPSWIDYGKVRVAYAEVGGDTDPYANTLYYSLNSNPFGGTALGSINSDVSPNSGLRPLKVKEKEAGLEIRTFNSRLNLDMSVYEKNTVDEILNVDVSVASGFNSTKVNIGKLRNRGVEALLTIVPIKKEGFNWETAFNGSYNASKVMELANGQARVDVGTGEFFGTVSHEIGLPLASLRGFDYRRDAQGRIVTINGLPQRGDLTTFGSAIPKWVGGWTNTFRYKGFRVFTQVDFKAGATLMSNSNLNFLREGLSKQSLVGREGGVVFDGVNPDGTPNTTAVEAETFYSNYRTTNIATPFIYNAAFVRWRSLSVGYDFSKYMKKTFVKGLNVSLLVNNVLMIKKYIDNLDPQASVSASDNLQGIESHTLPTTRSYGINVNVKL
ncbi:SusC/RagA family TonB-linked outer membrane protein [Mucilaginibacter sp. JRF]|uniref:SusC/RagA family TonB-linked outer membrane protein n=1 Tax=Mucilaginibacter sp. JRF TaxID=2780088 RepID=UPI001D16B60B|nr:SusC/RagA family TonB-linked outer membrane protein [Mucilaginibacter sp. JRF]